MAIFLGLLNHPRLVFNISSCDTPNPPSKKIKTPLRLMAQADRVFVRTKNYHQRGEINYDTRRNTIQVRRRKTQTGMTALAGLPVYLDLAKVIAGCPSLSKNI